MAGSPRLAYILAAVGDVHDGGGIMTRQALLNSTGSLLDLWPVPRRIGEPLDVSANADVVAARTAAAQHVRMVSFCAAVLNWGRLGYLSQVELDQHRAFLVALSQQVAPELPSNLRGMIRDGAALARDRFLAANRHAAELLAQDCGNEPSRNESE